MARRRRQLLDVDTPLTAAEQARVDALLASVGTHTLLHSLVGLGRDSQDARLIIAALMHRLPGTGDDGGDQAPVMPI